MVLITICHHLIAEVGGQLNMDKVYLGDGTCIKQLLEVLLAVARTRSWYYMVSMLQVSYLAGNHSICYAVHMHNDTILHHT